VTRAEGEHGREYTLTASGAELAGIIIALGTWGQRWLKRDAEGEDIDLDPVLIDMQRRARVAALPREPFVIRFALRGHKTRFILLKSGEASLCPVNSGFPERLCVTGPLAALVAWWRGDTGFAAAQRLGLVLDGPRAACRAFPGWFERYQLADIAPAIAAE
jgi:hypothetical protein